MALLRSVAGAEPSTFVEPTYSSPGRCGTTSGYGRVTCVRPRASGRTDRHPMAGKGGFGLPHRELAEVEDRRGEQTGGAAVGRPGTEVLERADAAARDERNVHRRPNFAQHLE